MGAKVAGSTGEHHQTPMLQTIEPANYQSHRKANNIKKSLNNPGFKLQAHGAIVSQAALHAAYVGGMSKEDMRKLTGQARKLMWHGKAGRRCPEIAATLVNKGHLYDPPQAKNVNAIMTA